MPQIHSSAVRGPEPARSTRGDGRRRTDLRTRTIPFQELSTAEIGAWRELAAAAAEPNPFFEPEFVLPLSEAMPGNGRGLMVVERGRDWLAALPVRRVMSWRRIPLPGTVGWKSSYTYLGSPLLHRDSTDVAARALLETAVRRHRYLGLELLNGGRPAAAALAQAADELGFGRTVIRAYERAALTRRSDPAEYLTLSPKHRRELRRKRDRLGEQLGAPVEAHDDTGRASAVDDFLRIEGSGWKREAGTALSSRPEDAAMFKRICRSFDALGRLQLLTIRAGEQTLASNVNLLAGDCVFCFKIGFDEDWSRFSPGVQLMSANADFFHQNPSLKWMDSCAEPTNTMINRLWPDRRPIEVTAITGAGTGRAAQQVFRAAVRARRLIRRHDDSISTHDPTPRKEADD
jgi:CelD/BcsL family acetyltransferase involved in cellulose biosynthesis